MDSDNLYPLDGNAFRSDLEQEDEARVEKSKALAAIPILEDIIGRFREKIAHYDSVDSIPPAVQLKPEEFLRMVEVNKLTKRNLINEVEWLEELIEQQR